MNSRQRFLAACNGQSYDRPPVWLMRQAGRYLPEYNHLRRDHSFWELVRDPRLAVEVSLQPLRRFALDAAIVFSDILIVPDVMGMTVRYESGGPVLYPLIQSNAELANLRACNAKKDLGYIGEAVRRLCQQLHPQRAVIGFAGAPFTLAAYMVEGGPAKSVYGLKCLAYQNPTLIDDLLERVATAVADLLILQIENGADAIQIFDTWAWHLSPDEYQRFALPATCRVFELIRAYDVPKILYLRNAAAHLPAALSARADVYSIDTSCRLRDARDLIRNTQSQRNGHRPVLQGNFDPALLTAPSELIRQSVQDTLTEVGQKRYIANLGQGLVPQTPVEGVAAFVQAVCDWSL